jgi:hypothetical protein
MKIGRGFLAGASAFGLASLVYYGLGLSNEVGLIEESSTWTNKVQDRVHSTYSYLGGGLSITTLSAILTSKSRSFLEFINSQSKLVRNF